MKEDKNGGRRRTEKMRGVRRIIKLDQAKQAYTTKG